jgi:hypothetical protein
MKAPRAAVVRSFQLRVMLISSQARAMQAFVNTAFFYRVDTINKTFHAANDNKCFKMFHIIMKHDWGQAYEKTNNFRPR